MKKLFADLDKEGSLKLPKDKVKAYLKSLATTFKTDMFVKAAAASDETFDEVWHDMGCSSTGLMSWHSVKPMLHRLIEQE